MRPPVSSWVRGRTVPRNSVCSSRVTPKPKANTSTSVTTAVADSRMPPSVTPSRSIRQKSAMSLGRAPQTIARSGSAARPTSAATPTGISPPSSSRCCAVGLISSTCAVLLRKSNTTRPAPRTPSVSAERKTRNPASGRYPAAPSSGPAIATPRSTCARSFRKRSATTAVRGIRAVALRRRGEPAPGDVDHRRRQPQPRGAEQHQRELQRRLGGRREVPAQRDAGEQEREGHRDPEHRQGARRLPGLLVVERHQPERPVPRREQAARQPAGADQDQDEARDREEAPLVGARDQPRRIEGGEDQPGADRRHHQPRQVTQRHQPGDRPPVRRRLEAPLEPLGQPVPHREGDRDAGDHQRDLDRQAPQRPAGAVSGSSNSCEKAVR